VTPTLSPAAEPTFAAVQQPADIAEVSDIVRQAAGNGHAVFPVGGGTSMDLGVPPSKPGVTLDTRRLDRVIDYPARDMTITVQAGLTVARLQALLAPENQRLPIDVPYADRATVGGIVAANVSGPRRLGCGTLRDYVIGISVVNDEGHEVKAGGRVVKNVAGYDLCKLYVGSLGTLGVITQLTFKLRPLPEEQALFAFACLPEQLAGALDGIHASRTRPVCVEVLNPAAAARIAGRLQVQWPAVWTVVVGYEDNTEGLQWQVHQLIEELGGRFDVGGYVGCCANPSWHELTEFSPPETMALSFKAVVPAAAVAAFALEADRLTQGLLCVHAGNGVVLGHCAEAAAVSALRGRALALGGHLVVTRCPVTLKTVEFVWGPPRGDFALMRAVKEKLDPRGVFNPGRFVGGI
jgi:glycolate oxidase FAD binding subunit